MAAELAPSGTPAEGPGVASWEFSTLSGLYGALSRTYQLGVSLPDAPLQVFRDRAAGLPRRTEAERLVVQRIGQDIFRKSLLEYWNRQSPLTGVRDAALLRASHIVAWAECDDDAQRLDVYNGLLLSALWDAAFDAGKISFANNGEVLFRASLGATERALLLANATPQLLGLSPKHLVNMNDIESGRAFESDLSMESVISRPLVLHLALHGGFFDAIAQGREKTEYREGKAYWRSRLIGRNMGAPSRSRWTGPIPARPSTEAAKIERASVMSSSFPSCSAPAAR